MHRFIAGAACSAVARRLFLAVVLAAICSGCKSTPKNPFLEQAERDQAAAGAADAQSISPQPANTAAPNAMPSLEAETAELSRIGAGVAAAAAGLGKEVTQAAKDAASRVRLAAAHTVAQETQEAERIAAHAVDTAQQVATTAATAAQRRAIESLAARPLEQAGPVLLLAIAEGNYAARKAAAEQLAARWPAAANFPAEAVAESRAAALAELRKLWIAQYGEINDAVAAKATEARALIGLAQERIAEAEQYVASLERLTSAAVEERRTAAAQLAACAASSVLPPAAIERLAELIERENDPLVWQSALRAVTSSAHESAERMAYKALENASTEVRREACNYLAAHGDPRHVQILLRAMADPQAAVQLAAVRALGAVGTLDDPRPLVELLEARDKLLSIEAALALARLRVERGAKALERLALDSDLEIRLRAAQAMGQIADPLYLPALVAMLGDQPEVQQAAMLSLARIIGTDVGSGEDGATISNQEKIRRWQRWYAERSTVAQRAAESSDLRR